MYLRVYSSQLSLYYLYTIITTLLVTGPLLCTTGRGHVLCTCFGRRRCLVVNVIRFDLSSQMPGRTGKQSNVHTAQHVIDGVHQHGVPGKEKTRQGQRRVLRE
jgi:hypothetical protein